MFLITNNKINITLCGMMGAGKSVVGRMLAKQIDFAFFDTDDLIEKNVKKSISQIFEEYGETYFRNLEEEIVMDLLCKKNSVISLGGGALSNKNIRNLINKNSFNIYLKVKIDILKKRLKNSKNRPLLYKQDLNLILNQLIKKREKFYKKADLIIENKTNIIINLENIIKNIRL